ncbi:MAG: hypothetical protein GXP08_01480 [Gammaproteobacteria bacterium]|nr:hypothetical protein [Gammaproteobacteria bacterium]
MTGLSSSPRLIKGALVGVDILNPIASVVVFQYNPYTMTRRLEARAATGGGDQGETLRLSGPPKETITLSIEIDAVDQLEEANPLATQMGIYPSLSALEMMLYPKTAAVIANKIFSLLGSIEILPTEAPFVLFAWGAKRVLPVRITSFSITEEAYDPTLNPIQAKVELSLSVLSYQDFGVLHPGHSMFLAHQMAKEVMASLNVVNSAQNVATGLQL